MKQVQFTDQEREILLKNPNILDVKGSRVKYCLKFKEYAVKEYLTDKYPSQIFIEAGIDVDILGRKNPQKCLSKWKLLYKDGVFIQKKIGKTVKVESFFGHLKDELDYLDCATFEELEKRVNEYIHYYNNNRYQSDGF